MNILTLSIKQKYFDEILSGTKTHEYREIRPTNAKKYITYLCGGKEYKVDEELPEEGEVELKPIKYDAIKLLTGAYSGKRPYIIVEVKNAEAVILTDPVFRTDRICIRLHNTHPFTPAAAIPSIKYFCAKI